MAKKTARRLVLSAAVFLLLVFSVTPIITAFAGETAKPPVQISMWLYPVGDFGNPETVDRFVSAFQQKHPEISVSVEYLDYSSGDDRIEDALSAGTAPDLVMEGPERLVADWGAKGVMADLSDLWTEDTVRDISADGDFVVRACKNADGRYFEYPLCKTVHCMAINYEVFERAGALQYLDPEKRTWTTENFKKACKAVADSGLVETPGLIYCGGQGGDQGTRAGDQSVRCGFYQCGPYPVYRQRLKGRAGAGGAGVHDGRRTALPRYGYSGCRRTEAFRRGEDGHDVCLEFRE